MKNVKPTPYISPELEIITFECNDIVTSSIVGEDDENILDEW